MTPAMLDERTAIRIREVLRTFPGLLLAYLFGSQVNGKAGPRSDYDFGVLTSEVEDAPALRARLAHELDGALGATKADVVILNRAPIELAYAVIAQGVVLYQRDEATRVEFEAGVMGRYGDYLPVLRAQRSDIYRGGEHAARVHRNREALGRAEREIGAIRASQGKESR